MSNRGKKTAADDDVEQLLRAAQDDALLKLSINSHIARATSSIDPDLDRRLQALKKPQNGAKIDDSVKTKPKKLDTVAKVDGAVGKDDDDLFARFAALKSTLPCYGKIGNESEGLVDDSINREVGDEESGDEVEKVIKWAIDAARLDPSPPTDDDDDDDDSEEDEDDDDDEIVDSRKKSKRK